MKWLFYVVVFVYMFFRAVYGSKVEHGLTVDPIVYGDDGFLKAGDHKNINCKASNRNQKVEWIYPNGSVVKRIPGNRIFAQEHFVSAFRGRTPALVLTVTKAEVEDTGVYQCRSGDNTEDISLCVIDPSDFVDTPTEVTANLGRSITLSCQAKGAPEPRLVWHRNGETITDEDSSAKYKVMTKYNLQGFEGLLTITSLRAEDSGVYSCVAIQETTIVEDCSHTETHNITLNVNYAPVFEGGNETNIYAKFNQQVDVVCSAKAFPAATYRLFKELPDDSLIEYNKKQISISEEKNEAVLTVMANSTTLQHRFKCIATNDQGSAEKFFTLLKTERPTRIDEVQIYDVSEDMVDFNLTWYEAVTFPVTAVDIQYVQDSNGDRKKAYSKDGAWRKSTQTEVEVINSDLLLSEFGGVIVVMTGLEKETSYWMRLRVKNDVGMSPWSDPVFVTTTAEDEENTSSTKAPEEPEEPESSVGDEEANDSTFYGIFFAGGILVVAFVCMFAMRLVK